MEIIQIKEKLKIVKLTKANKFQTYQKTTFALLYCMINKFVKNSK